MAGDPQAARAVTDWQARLGLLGAAAREVEPPAHVWSAIEARLADTAPVAVVAPIAANDNRVSPWWRSGAVAASLAALVLAGVAFNPARETQPQAMPPVATA